MSIQFGCLGLMSWEYVLWQLDLMALECLLRSDNMGPVWLILWTQSRPGHECPPLPGWRIGFLAGWCPLSNPLSSPLQSRSSHPAKAIQPFHWITQLWLDLVPCKYFRISWDIIQMNILAILWIFFCFPPQHKSNHFIWWWTIWIVKA